MTDVPPLPYQPKGGRPGHGRGFGSGGGRAKGQVSKITVALKEAILLAAETVGRDGEGEGGLAGYLTMVAATDIKSFCGLLGKVLPMTIAGDKGGALEVVFRTVYEEAAPKVPHAD